MVEQKNKKSQYSIQFSTAGIYSGWEFTIDNAIIAMKKRQI